jgi:hypothetical protein
MKSSWESLTAGIKEEALRMGAQPEFVNQYALGALIALAGMIVEGSEHEKKHARSRLQSLCARGRCLLNAEDLKSKEGQGEIL